MKKLLVSLSSLALVHCVDVPTDTTETEPNLDPGPTVEFDPGNSIIPTPNVLIMDPMTGRVNIPEQCNETATSAALRTGVLNTLDGFGTFKPAMQITLTHEVDPLTLPDRIVLMRTSSDGMPVDAAVAQQVPLVAFPGTSYRYTNGCDATPDPIDNITFVPAAPLRGNSTYVAVLKAGVTNTGGTPFQPSSTWALVRQMVNPVTVDESGNIIAETTPLNPNDEEDAASLLGVDLLWKAHAQSLAFVDQALEIPRTDILLAWNIKTQTITSPFDLAGTGPASTLPAGTPLLGGDAQPGMDAVDPTTYVESILGAGACTLVGCDNHGSAYSGAFVTNDHQIETPNPGISGGDPVPGPWADPLTPAIVNENAPVVVTAFIPDTTEPTNGWPVIVFGHGITRSRFDLLAIANSLTGAGFAVITFDWVAHGRPAGGGRAVQVDNTNAPCDGDPATLDPTDTAVGGDSACFAPPFSSNLATTRDNFRQSVLDLQALVNALKTCTTADLCGAGFNIDPTRIGYLGHSLGGILGAIAVPMIPDIKAAVLNVAGAGWVDILENTQRKAFQCPLVDALIGAGVLAGTLSDPVAETGTCYGDEWKSDPAWQGFANAARWVLDPGDPANFATGLGSRSVLLQEVVNDDVVPNVATASLGAIAGLTPAPAKPDLPPAASDAVAAGIGNPIHLQYSNGTDHTYGHSSILQPAEATAEGGQGTAQMRTDAITYLVGSLAP